MKKSIALIVSFLGMALGYAQSFVSENEIVSQKFATQTLYKSVRTGEWLDGDYKIALGAGNYCQVPFKQGRMNGKYQRFSQKGTLLEECNYTDGELDGKKTEFFEFANAIKRECYYKKGKPDGKWKEYDSDGGLIREDNFADGQLHGEQKRFDQDGMLRAVENYKNGVPHGKWWEKLRSNHGDYESFQHYKDGNPVGKWTEINENGTLKKEIEYTNKDSYVKREYFRSGKMKAEDRIKNHKYNGLCKTFYDTGVLRSEVDYKDDKMVFRKTYHSNGRKNEEWHFVTGLLHGKYLSFDADGKRKIEGHYWQGLHDGLWKYFYLEGDNSLEKEVTYLRGNKEGAYKSYYPNGKTDTEGAYKNNLMHGTWKYYTEGGKLLKEEVYDQQTLIKSTKYE